MINIENKITHKYPQPKSILEKRSSPYIYPNGIYENNIRPTLVYTCLGFVAAM